jgi:hypothetical protein
LLCETKFRLISLFFSSTIKKLREPKLGDIMRKFLVLAIFASAMGGCASTQLNYNTLDLAATTDNLEIQQIFYNVGKFKADPNNAVPAQVAIGSGTVQTAITATPSYGDSVTRSTAVATTVSATPSVVTTLTRTVLQVLGIQGSDQWTQSWAIAPINDGNALRRLSALYSFAANGGPFDDTSYQKVARRIANPKYDWASPPSVANLPYAPDSFFVSPSTSNNLCFHVLTSDEKNEDQGAHPDHSYESLSQYGRPDWFVLSADMEKGCLAKFVFLVRDAEGSTASPGVPGSSSGAPAKSSLLDQEMSAPFVPPPQIQVVPIH